MVTNDQISSATELYVWVKKASLLTNISVLYKCSANYASAEEFLESRFEKCKKIPGTQIFHCVEPNGDFKLKMKVFSACDDFKILNFSNSEHKRKSR